MTLKIQRTKPIAARTVAIIGAGGIGGVLAAALSSSGHDITLCLRTPIDQLVVDTPNGARSVPATIVTDPAGLKPVRHLLLTVKAQDTGSAANWLSALTDEHTTVVVLQNGVEHEQRVRPFAPRATLVPALAYLAAERTTPGRVRHGYGDHFSVPAGRAGDSVAALFEGSGIRVVRETDFLTAAWRKLLLNSAVNPITALTLRRMEVFGEPGLPELAAALMTEAAEVGRAAGARLDDTDVAKTLQFFDDFAQNNGTSMLYDRLAGRPLEYDALNGAVVRAAERHGIDVPLQRTMVALMRSLGPVPSPASRDLAA